MARTKRKSGPKTVYERTDVTSMRVSPLFKRLVAQHAERVEMSDGDFLEHLVRTRAAGVTVDEFPSVGA